MVKSPERVRAKMLDRVRTAGAELKAGMEAAPDPIDIALKDPEAHAKKMVDGLAEAQRRGAIRAGLEKAKKRNAWANAIDKAARHYEDAADDMVDRSMEDYPQRAQAIERAKAAVANMPTVTRDQRIAKGMAYQKAVAQEFDKLYGRK
jgi:hypothetical protein